MTDYSPATDFSAKDSLTPGTPGKEVSGADVDAELALIATSTGTKIDKPASPTSGDILYWNGSAWAARTPDARVQVLGRLAPFGNLAITNGATDILTFTADEVQVFDSSNTFIRATSISASIDVSVSGSANQLDAGTIATGWYYVWAISDGSTHAGLVSGSATAPTLPSGYTYKGLCGAAYYDTTDFRAFYQRDRINSFAPITIISASAGFASMTVIPSAVAVLPPAATQVAGSLQIAITSGTDMQGAVASTAAGLGQVNLRGYGVATTATSVPYRLALAESQAFYAQRIAGSSITVTISQFEM